MMVRFHEIKDARTPEEYDKQFSAVLENVCCSNYENQEEEIATVFECERFIKNCEHPEWLSESNKNMADEILSYADSIREFFQAREEFEFGREDFEEQEYSGPTLAGE